MYKLIALVVLTIKVIFVHQSESARILAVFPVPSISHQVVFRPLTQELVRRGHQVVVVTPDPAYPEGKTPINFTEIDTHDMSYGKWEELYKITSKGDNNDMSEHMVPGFQMVDEIFEMVLNKEEVQKLLKEKFDLLILEACVRSALTLSYVFKVPVIQFSSLGPLEYNAEAIGAPMHPLLYPSLFRQKLYNLTYWEKITEVWNVYRLNREFDSLEILENEMARRNFGPDIPSISELKKNVDMLFLNVHPIWDSNRPVPPSVVYLGGLHQNPVKELPKDLKDYLDSSKNGVIYMSLGTNVKPSMLPPEKLKMLLKVFSHLPYDVLWKWDKDELPGRTDNIRISKWLPQSDMLRHPKIKLFITQGGLQSTDEAITAGVPLIGIPMLGDQWYNVERYEYHKIGVRLDLGWLTEERFKEAIDTVINDESYRHNILRLRGLMRDQPQQPLERAVWWTEHLLRHGGAAHLRAPAANITWTEYLELELVLTVLGIAIIALVLIVFALFNIWRFISNNLILRVKVKST